MSEIAQIAKLMISDPPPPQNVNWNGGPLPPGLGPSAEPTAAQPEVLAAPETTRLFVFRGPDGKTYKVRGPIDATPEEAFDNLQKLVPDVADQVRVENIKAGIHGTANAFASIGTGILHGVLPTAMSALDVTNLAHKQLSPDTPAPFVGSQDVQNWLSNIIKSATGGTFGNLYEPQNRLERDLAAGGSMVPAIMSKNPQAIAPAFGGGVLGQELSGEMPTTGPLPPDAGIVRKSVNAVFGDPDVSRAVGNVLGMVVTAGGMHPRIASKYLLAIPGVESGARKAVEVTKELTNALAGERVVAPPRLPTRQAVPLPPTSRAGQIEDLAGALLRPKVPFNLPQQLENLTTSSAWPYMKALYRLLGIPETQYQANQDPSMQVPAQ